MDRSRVRGPYARFCERDEVSIDQLTSPYSIFPGDRNLHNKKFPSGIMEKKWLKVQ